MKIFLLYPEVGTGVRWSELLGLGMLGAIARQGQHRVDLLHYKHPAQLPSVETFVARLQPDLILAQIASDQWLAAQPLLQSVRKAAPRPMLICSGVFASVAPETAIAHPCVDAVAVGEVDAAFEDLIGRIASRQTISDTPNFWFKARNGQISKNAMRPLVADLDTLPVTDRSLYEHSALVESSGGGFPMLAGRGCPHNCQFCVTPRLKAISSGKGEFVRARNPMSIISEVLDCAKHEKIEWVDFVDEYFPQAADWLGNFCKQWRTQVRLPFRFTAVAERMTPEMLRLLQDAGCQAIRLSIDTGDEKFRARWCDKNLSNSRIAATREECRNLGIRVITHSLVGLPLESSEQAQATLEFNRSLRPDEVKVSIYRPQLGSVLHQMCREKGYLAEPIVEPDWKERRTVLNLPALSETKIFETYDALKAHDRELKLNEAGAARGFFDFAAAIDRATVESPYDEPLAADFWKHEHDSRFCLLQAVGSKATFPVSLRDGCRMEFALAFGSWPYAIRLSRPVQIEIWIRQGEFHDLVFVHSLSLSGRRSRRAWFEVQLPLVEWPAGAAEIMLSVSQIGAPPPAPVYVAWARPVLSEGAPGEASAASAQLVRKAGILEEELARANQQNQALRNERDYLRKEVDHRKQRVSELHMKMLEQDKELQALRAEKMEWLRQKQEIEASVTDKLKRLFKKE